jgi:hypothetical protein
MSTTKHTPGPWEVDRYYWTLQRRLFGDDEPEVQIIGRISETEDDEREANARLIAAAPELLENAQAALAALEQPKTYPADIEAAKAFLRSAIAKATGQ